MITRKTTIAEKK